MNGHYSVKVEEHSHLATTAVVDEKREELTAAANILSVNNGLGNVGEKASIVDAGLYGLIVNANVAAADSISSNSRGSLRRASAVDFSSTTTAAASSVSNNEAQAVNRQSPDLICISKVVQQEEHQHLKNIPVPKQVKHYSKENRYEDYPTSASASITACATKQNHQRPKQHRNVAGFSSKNKTSNAGLEKNFTKSLPSDIVAGSPPNSSQNRHRRTIAQRTISSGESIFKKLINSATSAYNKSLAAATTSTAATQADQAAATTAAAVAASTTASSTPTSTPEKQQMMMNNQSGGGGGSGPPSAQYGLVMAPLSALGAASTTSSGGGGDTPSAGPLKGNRDSIKADFSSDSLDFKVEEKIRRRIFVHYDCVSICASTQPLMSGTSRLDESILNAATGASRASRPNKGGAAATAAVPASSSSPMNSSKSSSWHTLNDEFGSDDDDGDGKSNAIVTSCAFFRNEVGGEPSRAVSLSRASSQQQQVAADRKIDEQRETWLRPSTAAEASIMENLSNVYFGGRLCAGRQDHMVLEYVDQGAFYYRHCFAGKAHQNYFGLDDNLGPVAISIIRDKIEHQSTNKHATFSPYMYRIIIRLSDMNTFRGVIMEESLPSYQTAKEQMYASSGGQQAPLQAPLIFSGKLPTKELIELTAPEVQLSCIRLAYPVPRTEELLLKLDEQTIYSKYKIGVLYCGPGQNSEEEMYNNKDGSPAFDEFLDMLGDRVRLKGFDKYKGGLDCKGDTTGQYSVYATYQQCEVMFHVSTLLPFTSNNKQQLSRKRHIGNDIVTIIFQDEGALSFSAHTVRSHFQHVFIIIRVHSPNTDNVKYSMAVSRCKDVPAFGPPIHPAAIFPKSKEFRDFLLTKAINAENAVHRSDKFATMAARTRKEFMKDLAENHVTSHGLEGATGKIGKILSGRRRDRPKPKLVLNSFVRGCIVWDVQVLVMVEDFSLCKSIECFLGISADYVVLIEKSKQQDVVFCTPAHSVIGWTCHKNSLKLYYDHAEMVILRTVDDEDASDMQDIVRRLQATTKGCDTVEMILKRNIPGQLGFHIQQEGIVSDVEMYGTAWQAGLRQGSRLVEISKLSVATLTLNRMLDLLITSNNSKVLVIPPLEDGSPRRGCEDPYCPYVASDDFGANNFISDQPIFYKQPTKRPAAKKQKMQAPTTVLTFEPDSPEEQEDLDDGSLDGGVFSKSLDELQSIRRRHSDECRSNSADMSFMTRNKTSLSDKNVGGNGTGGKYSVSAKSFETESKRCSSLQNQGPTTSTVEGNPATAAATAKFRVNTISSSSSSETSDWYRISGDQSSVVKKSMQHPSYRTTDSTRRSRKTSASGRRASDQDRSSVARKINAHYNAGNGSQDSTTGIDDTIRRQKSNPASVPAVRPTSQSSGQLTVPRSSKSSKNEPPLSPGVADDAREGANFSPLPTDSEESCSKHLRQMDYLPESERGVEWSSLVDAATRAIENMTQKALSLDSTSETNSYRLKYEAAQKRVAMLEGKVDRLQLELVRERESKRLLELDLITERNANKKLEEECVNANIELKKFAEWFVNAVENTNKPNQQSPGGPMLPSSSQLQQKFTGTPPK